MKYLIHTKYCWYDKGNTLVLMYFIQNMPFTFDELPSIAKDDPEILEMANSEKRWEEEDLYKAYQYLMTEECHPLSYELEFENPELMPVD